MSKIQIIGPLGLLLERVQLPLPDFDIAPLVEPGGMSGISHDENVSVVMEFALTRLVKDLRLGSDRSCDERPQKMYFVVIENLASLQGGSLAKSIQITEG